jgi:hypothetical protein
MKKQARVAIFMAMILAGGAQSALADRQETEHEVADARLEGYNNKNVTLNGGTSLMWMLLVFLGGVCVVGLFKDAKRSHLD